MTCIYRTQVVRYTALAAGIFYGISHRRTLQKQRNEQRAHEAVHQREELIHRAKEAWKTRSEKKDDRECLFLVVFAYLRFGSSL